MFQGWKEVKGEPWKEMGEEHAQGEVMMSRERVRRGISDLFRKQHGDPCGWSRRVKGEKGMAS